MISLKLPSKTVTCALIASMAWALTCGKAAAQSNQFEFLPISMMENEQLERSADFIRKNAQITDHYLLNMMWLIADTDQHYDAHAPVTMLRDRLEQYWDRRSLTATKGFNLDNNYGLRLKEKRLAIQYRYQF